MTDTIAKLRALYEASAPGKNGYVGAAMQIRNALPALLDVAEAARALGAALDGYMRPPSDVDADDLSRAASTLNAALRKLDEVGRG